VLKKIALLSLLALAFLALPALAQESDRPLINGIDANFPPFAYVDPTSGEPAGFDVEALNWIAAKMGFQVKHQPMEWDSIVTSLKDKKIDIIASGLSVSAERRQQIDFTQSYWVIKQVVVVKKDSALTLDDVLKTSLKIGVQRGTSDAAAMEVSNGQEGRSYELTQYDSFELAVADVINGRISAAVMNDAPAAQAAASQDVKILGEAGIPDEEFGFGVNKENAALLDQLNEGLTLLMADPYWQTLKDKWKPGEVH
jgi:polar amino acid transport system substrate-binding protein